MCGGLGRNNVDIACKGCTNINIITETVLAARQTKISGQA